MYRRVGRRLHLAQLKAPRHDAQENELSNDVAQVLGVRIAGRLLEVRGHAHDARHARRRRVRLLCRGDLRRGRMRLVGVERIHDRTDAPGGLLRLGDVKRRAHLHSSDKTPLSWFSYFYTGGGFRSTSRL